MEMRTLTKQVLNELIDHIDVCETQGTGKTGAGVNLLQTQKPIHHNSHYSDATPLARSESTAHRVKKQRHHQVANRSRSPAGPRRLGTATHMSASLSRRLFAFFGSTLDPDLKGAKYAVLPPDHAGVPKRVKQSEGSNSAPTQNAPCFGV